MKTTQRQAAKRSWTLRLAALLAGLMLSLTAAAAALDQAKADGWIGEKPDGYLGLVRSDAPADVQALVRDVNAKRKARYQQIASQQGAPLAEVEKVGGQTAIDKTRAGHYVMDTSGRWRKK
ncbi:MAG: YdbL family protein [Xanthomonadales bacterium]|jgi:uncharacterized protein YdbL (DUF1318 family)|nr:YdbL family protein [Xanthomonadales bacterium]